MSSVTKVTGSPSRTAKRTARTARATTADADQPSVSWRMGEQPMNAITSTATPTRWLISAMGRMSSSSVRAAHAGAIDSPVSATWATSPSASSN